MAESIINSFEPYPTRSSSQDKSNIEMALDYERSTDLEPDVNNSSISNVTEPQQGSMANELTIPNNQKRTANIVFSTYTDEKYGYSINYPSNVGLGKPFSLEDANPNLVGNLFSLDNSSEDSSNPAESAQAIVAAFYTNETDLITRLIMITPSSLPNLTSFNIDSVTSIANQDLSFYQRMPGFILLENDTTNLKNNHAYNVEYKYFNPVYRSMLQTKQIYVSHDDRLVVFQYSSNPSKYYEYLPTFQEMINSLEFEKP